MPEVTCRREDRIITSRSRLDLAWDREEDLQDSGQSVGGPEVLRPVVLVHQPEQLIRHSVDLTIT